MAESGVSWWEIDVPDVKQAQQFYELVCPGWTFQPMEGFEGYVIVNVAGTGAGALQASTDSEPSGRGIRLYVDASNLEDTLSRVRQGGGKVEQERMPIPGDQWIGTARDPFGNRIGFVTSNPA